MWLTLLWQNKNLIAEILGLLLVGLVAWWFFIHNPKIIDGLEKDKAELNRQVQASKQALELLDEIQKGKGKINAQVQSQISSVRSSTIPRRAVLIKYGVL